MEENCDLPVLIKDNLVEVIRKENLPIDHRILTCDDWKTVFCSSLTGRPLKGFARRKMAETARTFFDWRDVYYSSFPGDGLERKALEKMKAMACTEEEKSSFEAISKLASACRKAREEREELPFTV